MTAIQTPIVVQPAEQLITTVNTRDLPPYRWPLVRLLFPRFAEELELGHLVEKLLAEHEWQAIRLVPHAIEGEPATGRVFDVFGTRARRPD
jgi:hypothetical protein